MASTASPVGEAVQFLPLDLIVPSKNNPRKNIDETALAELAASIRQSGVEVPILVRPVSGKDTHEIIYGERRFRASKLADKESIPAIVREMSDEEAEEARFIENAQREDLSPLEEAQGFKLLLGNGEISDVAARTGKEESYVAKRLKLLTMIPVAQKALEQDKILLGHALEISRLNEADQKRVLAWLTQTTNTRIDEQWVDVKATVTVESLRKFIQSNLLVELNNAKFDIKDATLNPKMGACTTCPHNTANNGALFSDIKTAKCNLPECFFGKEKIALERTLEAVAEERGVKKVFRLAIGGNASDNRGLGAVEVDGYYRAGSEDISLVSAGQECEYTVPAAIVLVDWFYQAKGAEKKLKLGDQTNVCTDPKCKQHHQSASDAKKAAKPKGLALVDSKEDSLTSTRKQRTRNESFKQIVEKVIADDSFPKALAGKLEMIAPYVVDHLYKDRWRDAGKALGIEKPKDWETAVKKHFGDNQWALVLCVVMAESLPVDSVTSKSDALKDMAGFYKIDMGEVSSEVHAGDREVVKKMRDRIAAKAKPKKEKKVKAEKKPKAAKKAKAK